jgi:hypothetical protein
MYHPLASDSQTKIAGRSSRSISMRTALVQDFLHAKGVSCIDFPAYSPDLNPIENLWATLAREVEKKHCDTMEELQDEVERVWENVDKEHMRNLVTSMPQRCAAVIAAKGWHTDY